MSFSITHLIIAFLIAFGLYALGRAIIALIRRGR